MIPLIVIALGLGVALTVYEFSPKARSRVDAYAQAIRAAHAAHQTADAHLGNARNATVTAAVRQQQAASTAREATRPTSPRLPAPPRPLPVQSQPQPQQP